MEAKYTAHATMRNGHGMRLEVTAEDAVDARRRMFALNRAIASLTMPRASGPQVLVQPRVEHMRRAGDEVEA